MREQINLKKDFLKWLVAFFVLEVFIAKVGLNVKDKFSWSYNYTLIPIFFILTGLALKWKLLEIEKKSAALAIAFIVLCKLMFNGIPNKFIFNSNLIWQLFPSFFEEVLFRGILLKNLAEFELKNKYLMISRFPVISIIFTCVIFAAMHPPETFSMMFDNSLYFSLLFLVTKSYLAVGCEHFLQNTSANFW